MSRITAVEVANNLSIENIALQSRITELEEQLDTVRKTEQFFVAHENSGIPCQECGGNCVEFTIPSPLWNKVMRPEHTNGSVTHWMSLPTPTEAGAK